MIPEHIERKIDEITVHVRTAQTECGGGPFETRVKDDLTLALMELALLRHELSTALAAFVPDSRFAPRFTIGPMHTDAHNDLTCPECGHRVGLHGPKGCIRRVEGSGFVRECGCTKAFRL